MADGSQPGAKPKRELPHSYEIEQAFLGAVLCNNEVWHRCEFLKPDHFADALHGRIFEAIGKLIAKGSIADPLTLKRQFDQDGALQEVGGAKYLVDLAQAVVTVLNARDYAVAIRDLALRRRLIAIAEDLADDAYTTDPDRSPLDMLGELAQRIDVISGQPGVTDGTIVPMRDVMAKVLERANDAYKGGAEMRGLSTGIDDLDRILNGLCAGDMCVIAARPGMGKTTLLLNIARHVGQQGKRVGIESAEMTDDQLGLRGLAGDSGVNTGKVRAGSVTREDLEKLIAAAGPIGDLPIHVSSSSSPSIQEVSARWRAFKRRNGLDLLIIDYLQLLGDPTKKNGRYEEVTSVSKGIKALAKSLGIPVVALCQLSREVERRDNKRPTEADLKESGAIEQDADQIVFIYRHEKYLEKEEPQRKSGESQDKFDERARLWRDGMEACRNIAELICAKNRHGRTGTAKARFDAVAQRFENIVKQSEGGPPEADAGPWWENQ